MTNNTYVAISNSNTSFKEPRQKTWVVMQQSPYWIVKLMTTSFTEAQAMAKSILNAGGTYTSIDKIMICEIIPIDTVLTPTV